MTEWREGVWVAAVHPVPGLQVSHKASVCYLLSIPRPTAGVSVHGTLYLSTRTPHPTTSRSHFSSQGQMLFREFATPIPASGPLDTAADVVKMMGKMALGMVRVVPVVDQRDGEDGAQDGEGDSRPERWGGGRLVW